jgi:N-acetylneuraminic acid mutarotase
MCTVTGGSGTLMTSAGPSVAAITCTSTATAGGASGVSHSSDIYASRSAVAHQTPGARQGAASFADGAGNFWLFGGTGYDSAHNACSFSDLWRLAMDSNRWTLIAGSDANNAAGRYGTQGVSSPNVGPGARAYATTWTDAGGNLWLFGGQGRDGAGTLGLLNDLWKFTVDNDQWTWVAGSDKANAPGAYEGDTGPTPDKVPAARSGAVSWIDSAGNLWLFGGYGIDPTGAVGTLNDLWQFTPATGSWTRMSGSLTSAGA